MRTPFKIKDGVVQSDEGMLFPHVPATREAVFAMNFAFFTGASAALQSITAETVKLKKMMDDHWQATKEGK